MIGQLLTGATGSLGAHVLASLIKATSVKRVICLSRAHNHEHSKERILDSLAKRRISVPPEFKTKVVSYASDVNQDLLGLSPVEYRGIRETVTHVIHVSPTCD
jgi:thioester reductase-like protein